MTYVQLGNHTRKHRVKHIREKFWIHKSQKQKPDPCGDINAPKCFGDDYKCGLILLDLHCQSTNQITLACETSFVFALDDADALRQFQTYIRTYRLVIRVPGCKAGSWYAWVKLLANVTKYASHLVAKHHVSGRIAGVYLTKNKLQFFNATFPGIELGIHGESAALNRSKRVL